MSIKSKNEEAPKQSPESQEIDRILNEAYELMRQRAVLAKEAKENGVDFDEVPEMVAMKKEIKEKMLQLQWSEEKNPQGLRPGELSKLDASLEDPLLTNF